jgi:hypothetical protein
MTGSRAAPGMREQVSGDGHGMADAPELAAALRDVGPSRSDVEEALATLRRQRRFTVDAAYAYARRRDIDPMWRHAADLLELSVAERDRRVFRAPRGPVWR